MLMRAAVAAAISPAGRKSQERFRTYGKAINKENATAYNALEYPLKMGFKERVGGVLSKGQFSKEDLVKLPWSSRRLHPSRVASGLMAFLDDQGKNIPTELFPVSEMKSYLEAIKYQYKNTQKPLSVLDQFDLAMQMTNNNPVAASFLAHGAYRAIARSCDSRLDKSFNFPLYSSKEDALAVMDIAHATADFKKTDPHRDPLGDTYHFWAELAACMVFTFLQDEKPIATRIYRKAFYLDPQLTTLVRGKFLQHTPQFGIHMEADRQGYNIGVGMGKMMKEYCKKANKKS